MINVKHGIPMPGEPVWNWMAETSFFSCSRKGLQAQGEGRFTQAFNLLTEALRQGPPGTDSTIRLEIRRAECLFFTGQTDPALKLIGEIQARYPTHYRAFAETGNFYYRIHEFHRARRAFEQALRLRPDRPEIRSLLGRTLVDLSHFEEATRVLRSGLEGTRGGRGRTGAYLRLKQELALVYFYRGNFARAVALFRQIEKEDDSRLHYWDLYGRSCLQLGRFSRALDCFDRFLLHNGPEDFEIFVLKAKCHARLGELDEARHFIQLAAEKWGELIIYPADLKFFGPLVASGFLQEIGAVIIED